MHRGPQEASGRHWCVGLVDAGALGREVDVQVLQGGQAATRDLRLLKLPHQGGDPAQRAADLASLLFWALVKGFYLSYHTVDPILITIDPYDGTIN